MAARIHGGVSGICSVYTGTVYLIGLGTGMDLIDVSHSVCVLRCSSHPLGSCSRERMPDPPDASSEVFMK